MNDAVATDGEVVVDDRWLSERMVGGSRLGVGFPNRVWGSASEAAVGPLLVVDDRELVQQGLELVERLCCGLGSEPLLEGLMEPFDLATGLRVIGA